MLTVTRATLSLLMMTRGTIALPLGLVQPLRVIGTFSDGLKQDLTEQAVWASSDTSRVAVGDVAGAKGKITAVAIGSATVTAAFGGMSAPAAIDVTTGRSALERGVNVGTTIASAAWAGVTTSSTISVSSMR
jgi:hypothetical protein